MRNIYLFSFTTPTLLHIYPFQKERNTSLFFEPYNGGLPLDLKIPLGAEETFQECLAHEGESQDCKQ